MQVTPRDIVEAMSASYEARRHLAPAIEKVLNPRNLHERFSGLRELYKAADAGEIDPTPYFIDWTRLFTPIERQVWCDLRCAGVDMWPQYPAGRFFLDFADPYKRIAIECDGKRWHDKERDRRRDQELLEDGWLVFRFSGSDCNRSCEPDWEVMGCLYQDGRGDEAERKISYWLNNTSEGGVRAIGQLFYEHGSFMVSRAAAYEALSKRLLAGEIGMQGAI